MDDRFLSGARFYEWDDLPLVATAAAHQRLVLNCAFDPPRQISARQPLQAAREISFAEFERLRAVYRAARREYFRARSRAETTLD